MGRTGSGVEVRDSSIRLSFVWEGAARRETLLINGKPAPPTPANVKWAHRLAAEIRQKIKHDAFVYADYFPASRHASTGQGATVGDRLDVWRSGLAGLEDSTLKAYDVAVRWWKARLGQKLARALVKSDILTALATEPTWTGKTRNNKMSVLRQALQLAVDDKAMASNPCDGIDAFEHQDPEPDPFTREEAEAIVADMHAHYRPEVALYFETKFFTGMRTSESLGLRWESVDFRRAEMVVKEAIVLGQHKTRTKTNRVRTVQLNSRALAALKAQKAHTFLKPDGWVFMDPRSGARYVDDWTPREMYWRPCLKRLGVRYRSPYNTRHTYATMMLMAGMTPAFCARQLGHSIEQFLRTYSKWIDGGHNALEMAKLEAAIAREESREENAQPSALQRNAS